jgi:plastocyanin
MSTRPQQVANRALIVLGVALVVMTAVAFIAHDGPAREAAAQPASAATKRAHAVRIKDFLYDPEAIEVAVGAKVTFTNADSAPHTATSQADGAFDTGTLRKGESRSVTLDTAGTFTYYCAIHPFMKATVTVR